MKAWEVFCFFAAVSATGAEPGKIVLQLKERSAEKLAPVPSAAINPAIIDGGDAETRAVAFGSQSPLLLDGGPQRQG